MSDATEGAGYPSGLQGLTPYHVRLSITYDYLVLAGTYTDACSTETAKETLRCEEPDISHEGTWRITANETDLRVLPAGWDEGSLLYGPLENVSVREVRNAIAERESASLVVDARVYDRRMDLFGRIETISEASDPDSHRSRARRWAKVKYEYPMSPDAAPREVRLGELIAADKVERG